MLQEYTYTGKAFGTDFSLSFVTQSEASADRAKRYTLAAVTSYEQQFSRFQSNSELSRVNRGETTTLTPRFMSVLVQSYQLFERTRGVFNPLLQISRLGYTADFSALPLTPKSEPASDYNIDFTTTFIDTETNQITLAPGQQLDFGGLLKGYVADTLVTEIRDHDTEVSGIIINLGGDIATAGHDATGTPFIFSIWNPITHKEISPLIIENACLATSGTYKRHWTHDDTERHHILDHVGTGNPQSDIVSASIIHHDGSTAEAYAKVFIALGPSEALSVLRPDIPSYLTIDTHGTISTNLTTI